MCGRLTGANQRLGMGVSFRPVHFFVRFGRVDGWLGYARGMWGFFTLFVFGLGGWVVVLW